MNYFISLSLQYDTCLFDHSGDIISAMNYDISPLWLRASDVAVLGAHAAFVGSTLIDVKK